MTYIYGDSLNRKVLQDALIATSKKRGSTEQMQEAEEVIEDIMESMVMQKLWISYQKKFLYAQEIDWNNIMASVLEVYRLMN